MDKEIILKIVADNHLIAVAIAIAIAVILSYTLRKFLTKFIANRSDSLNIDPTRYNFMKNASTALIIGAALAFTFYAIPSLRSIGTTLFAGAGIAAAASAFASQQALSNIIGGVFLVIFRPFRVGDIIHVAANSGEVEDITLRHTVIKSFENRRIIIPNAVMSNETIVNSSIKEEKMCRFIEFGISYDSSVDLAKKIIREEAIKHPEYLDGRTPEEKNKGNATPRIAMTSHGDFAITLRTYFWCGGPIKAMNAHWDLLESVKKRFDAEGIEIPFPYRTIVYKNDIDGTSKKET